MKKYFFLFLFCFSSSFAFGQQKAVTDNGDEVILYVDGTWAYVNHESLSAEKVVLNETPFSKPKKASFLIKSKRIPVGCYIDPKTWKFKNSDSHEASEFELTSTDGDLFGMVITEKLDLPLESLAQIAVENALDAAPDLRVTHKEYRMVNGIKVMMMRMSGTIQDIRFSYYGYYYTGEGGATQFLVYSSDSTMDEKLDQVEELLNGLVRIDE